MPLPLGSCLMTEKLLQFIWQFQYFAAHNLQTSAGEKLEIIFPGNLNPNQGPDFTDAHIKIDHTFLAGSVELHLKTSQWKEHGHQNDENYKNVILHVVLEHNESQHKLPVLELQSFIPGMLLQRYEMLMNSPSLIACAGSLNKVKDLIWCGWKERLLAERLIRKSNTIFNFLQQNNWNWDETFWWLLARNFGATVNTDAFESVARSIPFKLFSKHQTQLIHIEALLLGQAGLLNNVFKEPYPKLLQREYRFFKKKYALQPVSTPVHFLRMRPGNFPSVRLAQLAAVLQDGSNMFSSILRMENLQEIRKRFMVTANDYWHYHYMLDEPSSFRKKTIGNEMIDHIVINTMVPLVFAYGLRKKQENYTSTAIRWLEETNAENNTITKSFTNLGLIQQSAFDSQAFIELKTKYCEQKLCLQCAVGNAILNV